MVGRLIQAWHSQLLPRVQEGVSSYYSLYFLPAFAHLYPTFAVEGQSNLLGCSGEGVAQSGTTAAASICSDPDPSHTLDCPALCSYLYNDVHLGFHHASDLYRDSVRDCGCDFD